MAISSIRDLKYKSDFLLPWKKSAEKKSLIRDINKLIADFNRLDDDLLLRCSYSAGVERRVLADNELSLHRQYLLQYLHEIRFNIAKLSERLSYNRNKEFEKFLKSLQGMTSDNIVRLISEFRRIRFSDYGKDAQTAVSESFEYTVKQIIRKDLKIKQKSRQKQLLKKFEIWEKKLPFSENDNKQIKFAGVVKSLVEIFSGHGKNLDKGEIKILKDCFSSNRNWCSFHEKMNKSFNPFPNLNEDTNRVIITLYGMVTDRDGKDIDPLINKYLA